jgi:hypothetical protein|nr:MAG TPA: hypothetical protein [Caudoviricetes sp.]
MEKVVGTYGICNVGGIAVYAADSENISYRYEWDGKSSRLCHAKVQYVASGRAYFRSKFGRIYLDEVMRTN